MHNERMEMRWGIDLGGTKIEGIVLPPNDVKPIARIRIDTEQEGGYEHVLKRIDSLVDLLAEESGLRRPDRIGLAMPGTIEPSTSLAKNCNTVCLNGKPLGRDLSELLQIEVRAQNDANCFALAEATMGAARGADVVFGAIMGTGVGGGVVVNRTVIRGHHGIAGEWGHNQLIADGEPCYCGKRGCVETVLSGPALERYYRSLTGASKKLRDIAYSDEPEAHATIERLCDYFGLALASVVNVLDPDAIVLGGGVGNIEALYTRGRASLGRWIFNDRLDVKLLSPELGDSAGVFGAAALVSGP